MSDSKRRKGGGKSQWTGRPSGKDRSAHEAARGKRLETFSELSRALPSEEDLKTYPEMLTAEPSDRSAAIMAAGLVEQALYVAITSRLADPGEAIPSSWFEGSTAPFATFSAKIKLGRAIGIYGPKMDEQLCRIKDIRNVFAHRSTPIDFSHPTLRAQVRKMAPHKPIPSDNARVKYLAYCFASARLLITDAFEFAGREIKLSFP